MRILVLIHEFPPIGGGGGRVAQDLCQGFAERGHEVKVLTADLGGLVENQSDSLDFSVIRLPSGRREAFLADLRAMSGYILAGFWAARKIIKDWQPDLVHVHFAVPAGPIAWLLLKIERLPYVLTTHLGDVPGGAPEKTEKWFRWIRPFVPPIWDNAARVVAVSEYTRLLALKQYPVDISVIPNGVDIQKFKPDKLVRNEVPRIVFAGRFMEQKNPLQLVRVLARLQELPWECTMFGDGLLRPDVEKEIVNHQLEERIQLRGWVAPPEVIAEFSRSEILFMPSRSEGLPVVGVQALASGMAIVAGNAGGFIDLVKPGENGFLYDPDDVEGMCEGLRKLLSEPETLLHAREKSLTSSNRYDLASIISQYEQLFADVIDEAR
jgi:glycosyltransferase involved in cell wall biosynthesis